MLDICHAATFPTRREAYATAFDAGLDVDGLKFFRDESSRQWGWKPADDGTVAEIEIEAEPVAVTDGPVEVMEIEIEADGAADGEATETPAPCGPVAAEAEPVAEAPVAGHTGVAGEMAEELVFAARDKLVTVAILDPGFWGPEQFAETIARKLKVSVVALDQDGRPLQVFAGTHSAVKAMKAARKRPEPGAPKVYTPTYLTLLAARERVMAAMARPEGASIAECQEVSGWKTKIIPVHLENIAKHRGYVLRVAGGRFYATRNAIAQAA